VQYGPVSADQLRQWIAEGRADANTQVQAEGTTDWKPLRDFPEFAANLAQQATAPPAPAYAAPPPGMAPTFSAPGGVMPRVPNYLVQAILCTLCCCLPFGVVAIVYAAQVNGKLQDGDYEGAVAASKNAKMWCWISFGIGLAANIVFLILGGLNGILENLQNH
jgi:hypothetical protein